MRVAERRGIRGFGTCSRFAMRDQAVECELATVGECGDGAQVGFLPLCSDAESCFAHEGGRKREGDLIAVEAGERDLAAWCEPLDEAVENAIGAAHFADGAIVAAR